jgi:hypothetical protein
VDPQWGSDQATHFSGWLQSILFGVQLQVLQLPHPSSEQVSHSNSRDGGFQKSPEMATPSGLLQVAGDLQLVQSLPGQL